MSSFGIFESVSTDGVDKGLQREAHQRGLLNAEFEVKERFGKYLAASTSKRDHKDRLSLVGREMREVVEKYTPTTGPTMKRLMKVLADEFPPAYISRSKTARMRKAAQRWTFDTEKNAFITDNINLKFSCTECGSTHAAGFNRCGCGKVWNITTVRDGDRVQMFAREVLDRNTVLAKVATKTSQTKVQVPPGTDRDTNWAEQISYRVADPNNAYLDYPYDYSIHGAESATTLEWKDGGASYYATDFFGYDTTDPNFDWDAWEQGRLREEDMIWMGWKLVVKGGGYNISEVGGDPQEFERLLQDVISGTRTSRKSNAVNIPDEVSSNSDFQNTVNWMKSEFGTLSISQDEADAGISAARRLADDLGYDVWEMADMLEQAVWGNVEERLSSVKTSLKSEYFEDYLEWVGEVGLDPYAEDTVDAYIEYRGLGPEEAEDLHREVGHMFTMSKKSDREFTQGWVSAKSGQSFDKNASTPFLEGYVAALEDKE